ncbi:hypothetical protein A9Q99_00455 [Gammaproteobacteria bacterium 45_16_T64]|nr:hypothetical protein A9Q99_00455 [Gammaproteobacteria bacterium 45_16_T64]
MLRFLLVLLTFIAYNTSASQFTDEPLPYTGTPDIYPACSAMNIRVTDENYQGKYLALAGLTGVYVVFDYLEGGSRKNNVSLDSELVQKVRSRLNRAGLKLLTKEEMLITPGQPKMEIYPNFPSSQVGDHGISSVENNPCCTAGLWVSYFEGASILRQPNSNYILSTWGQGDSTHDCSTLGNWMSTAVLRKIDAFIDDFERAQSDFTATTPETVSATPRIVDIPVQDCSTPKTIYSDMFKAGSYQFSRVRSPELNELANTINRCPDYRFMIEAHADIRSTPSFNQVLTEKRAQAIKFYLLAKNVSSAQFETKGKGEHYPIAHGNTEKDHAMNRRIEVTAFRVN